MNGINAEHIYDLYFDTVYKICFLYMKNHTDAQDITQETFCHMLQKNFRYESDEKTKAWLIVCASNLCKNHLKKWWVKRVSSFDEAIGKEEQEAQSVLSDSESREVYRTVMNLDKKYAIPTYLYYYEGYKTAEIAKILGTNPSTVQTRLAKARELLKLELE